MGSARRRRITERGSPLFEQTVRLVRIAGWLMIAAAVFGVPASLALKPAPPLSDYGLAALTLAAGLLYLLAPQRWLSSAWIHVAIVGGALAVALAVALFSPDYGFFMVLPAIYAAYAVPRRDAFSLYLAVLALAIFLPLVYRGDLDEAEGGERPDLVTLPVMLISAVAVRELRETLERRQLEYRAFAREAIGLAQRIRGSARGDLGAAPDPLDHRLEELSHRTRDELNGEEPLA